MKLPINQIICGDCLEVMKDWPDNCVDLVLTDPPYGGVLNKKHGHGKLKEAVARYGDGGENWDFRPKREVFIKLRAVGRNSIIWGGNYFASDFPDSRCWLVWNKINGSSSFADCELAWTSFDEAVRIYKQHVSTIQNRVHPTQKPEGLMRWCLGRYSQPKQLILDPFCGSGTTCVAAKMLGRRYIGIDISEKYCEISRERLSKVRTGCKLGFFDRPKKKKKVRRKGLLE